MSVHIVRYENIAKIILHGLIFMALMMILSLMACVGAPFLTW